LDIKCNQCGNLFYALNKKIKLCLKCKNINLNKKNEHHCYKCKKTYIQKDEYKNYKGQKSLLYCKSCLSEWKIFYCEDFIYRVHACKKRFDNLNYLNYTLKDEIRFIFGNSRNDIRAFGWNTNLVSKEYKYYIKEYNKSDFTYDHINGMTFIITETANRIAQNILKTPNEVANFLDQKSCVIKVTKKLNTTTLKKLQNEKAKAFPKLYFEACNGMFFNDNELTYKEFIDNFSQYFIF